MAQYERIIWSHRPEKVAICRRSEAQKKECVNRITEMLAETLQCKISSISVAIKDTGGKKSSIKAHSQKGDIYRQGETVALGKRNASKLLFETPASLAAKSAACAAKEGASGVHRKISENEDENAAMQADHEAELSAENSPVWQDRKRMPKAKKEKLAKFIVKERTEKSPIQSEKQLQKERIKRENDLYKE